jgi:hypothetical protein
MIEQWKRLWFVLDETKLFYVSDPHEDGSYHAQVLYPPPLSPLLSSLLLSNNKTPSSNPTDCL